MNMEPVQLERRAAQRFEFHLPVGIKLSNRDQEGSGFTQDLSARGALLYTDFPLAPGDTIELTLVMPSEVTLAENMRVRCQGRVTRVSSSGGSKCGVAVRLDGYEFLPERNNALDVAKGFARVSPSVEPEPDAPKLDPLV